METIELKVLNEEEAKKLSKEVIMSTVTLSFRIEAMLAEEDIHLRSVFIDTIAKAILDEQEIEKTRS